MAPDDWANLEVRTVGLLPWLHLCWSVLVCAWLSQESLTSGLLGGRVLGVVDLEQVVLAMAIEIRHQCLHEHLYFGRLGGIQTLTSTETITFWKIPGAEETP